MDSDTPGAVIGVHLRLYSDFLGGLGALGGSIIVSLGVLAVQLFFVFSSVFSVSSVAQGFVSSAFICIYLRLILLAYTL
jgi:hypothetical protein